MYFYFAAFPKMPPPHWSDPLPYRPVNNGDPPRPQPTDGARDGLAAKGTRRVAERACLPRVEIIGRPRNDEPAPAQRVPCTRNGLARLGRKIIK